MVEAVLGIDIGTTSTKAVLFDLAGVEVARAVSAPYRTRSPQPGWVEQDPEEVWQAVVTAVRTITSQIGGGNGRPGRSHRRPKRVTHSRR